MVAPILLGVSLPAMAAEIHGDETGTNVSLGSNTLTNLSSGYSNTAIGKSALRDNDPPPLTGPV